MPPKKTTKGKKGKYTLDQDEITPEMAQLAEKADRRAKQQVIDRARLEAGREEEEAHVVPSTADSGNDSGDEPDIGEVASDKLEKREKAKGKKGKAEKGESASPPVASGEKADKRKVVEKVVILGGKKKRTEKEEVQAVVEVLRKEKEAERKKKGEKAVEEKLVTNEPGTGEKKKGKQLGKSKSVETEEVATESSKSKDKAASTKSNEPKDDSSVESDGETANVAEDKAKASKKPEKKKNTKGKNKKGAAEPPIESTEEVEPVVPVTEEEETKKSPGDRKRKAGKKESPKDKEADVYEFDPDAVAESEAQVEAKPVKKGRKPKKQAGSSETLKEVNSRKVAESTRVNPPRGCKTATVYDDSVDKFGEKNGDAPVPVNKENLKENDSKLMGQNNGVNDETDPDAEVPMKRSKKVVSKAQKAKTDEVVKTPEAVVSTEGKSRKKK